MSDVALIFALQVAALILLIVGLLALNKLDK
jgi:hypothetical protein